jgi:hypothetical protein
MKPLLVQLGGHDTHDETARQRGYVVKVLTPLHRMLAVAALKRTRRRCTATRIREVEINLTIVRQLSTTESNVRTY